MRKRIDHPFLFRATTKLAMLVVGAGVIFTILPILRSDDILVTVFRYGDEVVTDVAIIWSFLLLLFSVLDSIRRLGSRKTVLFMALIFGLSFPAEYLGSKYGWFFGLYVYSPEKVGLPLILGQVPVVIIYGWWIIMYLSFFTTNTLVGSHRQNTESSRSEGKAWSILRLLPLAAVDGVIATSLDLSLEPLLTEHFGLWQWVNAAGGSFSGVPLSNYIHWFLLVMGISLIFRAYLQAKHSILPKQMESKVRFWPEYATPVVYFLFQSRMVVIIIRNTSHYEFVFSSFVATSLLILSALLFQKRKRSSPQLVRSEISSAMGNKRDSLRGLK